MQHRDCRKAVAEPLRILCLAQYYPPETGALANRMSENAEAWARAGAKVTVVTCTPNYPRGRVFGGYRNALLQRETINGVDVVRVGSFIAANEGFLLRTLSYVSFAASATLQAWRLPKCDVVFSTSPNLFAGLAGWSVSRLKRKPWAFEVRDLWPESIAAVGALRNGWALAPIAALARFAYRKADLLVSVTDSFVPHLIANGATAQSVAIVKNGVDLSRFSDGRSEDFRAAHGLEGKFVCAYVGTHGMAHKLETVLLAARELAHRKDIAILMVGDGAEREKLLALRQSMGLENVVMVAQLPREEMPNVMAATDVSLVVLADDPVFRSVIPSKIFEAMAMRRPIILGVRGEAQQIIEDAGAGLAVAPENPVALARAILRLADSHEARRRMGENGRRCVEQEFDRTMLAAKLLAALGAIARPRKVRDAKTARMTNQAQRFR